jgi:hypothetical protein
MHLTRVRDSITTYGLRSADQAEAPSAQSEAAQSSAHVLMKILESESAMGFQ